MAEWLVERGIGEDRALLADNDQIIAARLDWPGMATAGQIEDAVLIVRTKGSTRGTASLANGEEVLVDRLPASASEGSAIRIEVTRSRIGEKGRIKRAQGRPTDLPTRPAPSLLERLQAESGEARIVRRFPNSDWEDIWGEAWSGICDFPGGSLHFSVTPAMVLVDVDGTGTPRELALAACAPIAAAIRRFDLAGSIGIDFPTLSTKQDRKAVDEALAAALDDLPHERTAINGFGFVQIISRFTRPSLLHLIGGSRTAAAARILLRRAEGIADAGAILLTVHPALQAQLKPQWLEQLSRRTGREVRIATDPGLALESGFAQAVPL